LPAGVGVQWLRDTGGSVDPGDGRYTPAYDRYTVVDAALSGPTSAGSTPDVLSPLFMSFQHLLPDGTAMFPYNGFAGEGITGTAAGGVITMTFPAGSCRISLFDTDNYIVFPSPDGTKAAVHVQDSFTDFSGITIVSLVDGGECPRVVRDVYVTPGPGGNSVAAPAVWAPDSSAVAYAIRNADTDPGTERVVRLAAVAGATPIDIVPATPETFVPLGWSVAGRVLVETLSQELNLFTVPVSGGPRRMLDRVQLAGVTTPLPETVLSYLGYFVPGSTTVVFTASSRVTNSSGQTYPWLQLRRIADADGATSAPLVSPKAALTWHQAAIDPTAGPPFTLVDVPDSEVLERFVH
jgi:hypothetical protein